MPSLHLSYFPLLSLATSCIEVYIKPSKYPMWQRRVMIMSRTWTATTRQLPLQLLECIYTNSLSKHDDTQWKWHMVDTVCANLIRHLWAEIGVFRFGGRNPKTFPFVSLRCNSSFDHLLGMVFFILSVLSSLTFLTSNMPRFHVQRIQPKTARLRLLL